VPESETSSETKDALPEKSLACELGIREDLVTRAMLASIAYFIYDLWAMFTVHTMREKERRGIKNANKILTKVPYNNNMNKYKYVLIVYDYTFEIKLGGLINEKSLFTF